MKKKLVDKIDAMQQRMAMNSAWVRRRNYQAPAPRRAEAPNAEGAAPDAAEERKTPAKR